MKIRFSPGLIAGIAVAVFFGLALIFRVVIPYDQIFSGDWIKLATSDAYYFMRQVDSLAHNFPQLLSFDPYLRYPYGLPTGGLNLFVYLVGGISWIFGLGSPSQHTIDVIGAYFPAIVGALTVIPVYFIGRVLFNRWGGILAAGLLVLLPGELLGRSILGATDRDSLEVFFTAVVMLFVILAIKEARQKSMSFSHFTQRDWTVIKRPLIYSLLAGILLGCFLLTWRGAYTVVLVIFVYSIIQFIIDHLKRQSIDYLYLVNTIVIFIALIITLSGFQGMDYIAPLILTLAVVLIPGLVSLLMAKRRIKVVYYPLTLFGLGIVGLAIFYAINPSLLKSIFVSIGNVLFQPTTELTVMEQQPILFPQGEFSFAAVWANFTTSSFLCLISLGVLIYLATRQNKTEHTLFIVWSLLILVFTLAARRFALLFAVNVALLSGYLAWLMLKFAGLKETLAEPAVIPAQRDESPEAPAERSYYEVLGIARDATRKEIKKAFRRLDLAYRSDPPDKAKEKLAELHRSYEVLSNPQKRSAYDHSKYGTVSAGKEKSQRKSPGSLYTNWRLRLAIGIVVVFFLVFFPNIGSAINEAEQVPYAPADAWYQSLDWMRDNTPDPFGDPDFYYRLAETPFSYDNSVYTVLAWWDFGYQIARVGHRVPNTDPGGGARVSVAQFFTAQDESSADAIINELKSRYVMIDYDTTVSLFYAIVLYADKELDNYMETFYIRRGGTLQEVMLFHPEYYRSLSVRMYNFEGKEVTPENTMVISYQERPLSDGTSYKEVTSAESFTTYEEAEAFVLSQSSGNYHVVGTDPFISPVPLEALEGYQLVYSSKGWMYEPVVGIVPQVKIFEYTR